MDKNDKRDDKDKSNDSEGLNLGETLKRVVTAGIGAAFMTEESIRGYLQDLKLPKEMLGIVLQGAQKSKDELVNKISNETMRLISKIDFVKEASRFVEEHKFKVTAEIEVVKKKD